MSRPPKKLVRRRRKEAARQAKRDEHERIRQQLERRRWNGMHVFSYESSKKVEQDLFRG